MTSNFYLMELKPKILDSEHRAVNRIEKNSWSSDIKG